MTPPPTHTHTRRGELKPATHTWDSGDEPQRPQHPEGPQRFHVQASGLPGGVVGLPGLVVRHPLRDHAEQPGQTRGPASEGLPAGRRGPGSVPDDDDDEVQQVPAAADVGAGVHDQTVGQDLGEGLDGEDDEEDVLHLFLRKNKRV